MKLKWAMGSTVMMTLGLGAAAASAQVLFTTQEDFSNWGTNGSTNMVLAVQPTSLDNSIMNGLGNPNAPGIPGTNGALSATWTSGTYNFFYSPGEQGNTAFLAALGTTADATAAPTTGTIKFDYTVPPAGNGNYFELNLVLNYDGNFGQFSGTSLDNGNGSFTRTIDYTINPHAALSYFQLGIIYNSNYDTTTPFAVDNIRVIPEPASMGLMTIGVAPLMFRRRGRRGN